MSMIVHYDLHIHSVLSPCADCLMTPNNIINMADLNGLDLIAVTDHNAARQLPVLEEIIRSYDMLLIPGIEITLGDDSHVLCYFKTVKEAYAFGERLTIHLGHKPRSERSYVMDVFDRINRYVDIDFSRTTDLSMSDLKSMLKGYDHLLVAAHVDRTKNNALHHHSKEDFDCLEHTRSAHSNNPEDNSFCLHSSDAHQLTQIHEATEMNRLELDELSVDDVFRRLRHG